MPVFALRFGQCSPSGGDQIVRTNVAAKRSCDRQLVNGMVLRLFDGYFVPIHAEGEDRLDRMAPIRQFAADMKREVELCRRSLPRWTGQGAALAGFRPEASLALIRASTSSSAVTEPALHAKRASNRRPDVNRASPRCSWISAWSGSFSAARWSVVIASPTLPRLNCAQPSESVIDASSGDSALALRIIASDESISSPRSSLA